MWLRMWLWMWMCVDLFIGCHEFYQDDPHLSLRSLRSLPSPQVPFVGKDVPSRASEFSHPDIVIGLTIAAYRYEGLRFKDFHAILR